jgi:hypothetical protein
MDLMDLMYAVSGAGRLWDFSPRARVVLLGLGVYFVLRVGCELGIVSAIDVGFLRWGQRDEPMRARLCVARPWERGAEAGRKERPDGRCCVVATRIPVEHG